jgi:hypothetical protein
MLDELLSDRVERLEKTVEGLQTLPAQVAALGERVGAVETQILQLRGEMHVEFSDVRGEMRAEFAAVRSEMRTEFAAVRSEMQVGITNAKTELRQEIAELREEVHEGFAAARDDMLVGLASRFKSPRKRGHATPARCSRKPSVESPLWASTAKSRAAPGLRRVGVSGSGSRERRTITYFPIPRAAR